MIHQNLKQSGKAVSIVCSQISQTTQHTCKISLRNRKWHAQHQMVRWL